MPLLYITGYQHSDDDLDYNSNTYWSIDHNSSSNKAKIEYIQADYGFGVDVAPEDWTKKAKEEETV